MTLPLPLPGLLRFRSPVTEAEVRLLRLALDLGALRCGGPLSDEELDLVRLAGREFPLPNVEVVAVRKAIAAGGDPLGERLCRIRLPAERRAIGAFYTPSVLVEPMLDWVLAQRPFRIVDPGCGSGRFAAGVVRRAPDHVVVAIDIDPVATLLTRATLAALGARNATVSHADYAALNLPPINRRTAFIGNPPYVRHHDLAPLIKYRAITLGKMMGYSVSRLSGLHAHFYLATAAYAAQGDVGCF